MQWNVCWRADFQLATVWACSSVLGYSIASELQRCVSMDCDQKLVSLPVFCLASFATLALGFTQTQASTLQSILSVGQLVGRPASGWLMDKFGRLNIAALASFLSGVTLLALWLPARSFGLLSFFALAQGMVGGIFWSACTPVTADLVG